MAVAPAVLAVVAVLAAVATGCGDSTDSSTKTTAPPTTTTRARPSAGCEAARNAPPTGSPAPVEQTVSVEGVERRYLVAAQGAKAGVPAPLVVLLHGMGSSAADIDRVSNLPERAGAGMIVVTPQALGSPTLWRPVVPGADAAFVDQILADVGRTQCVDLDRVHLAGFSVGAAFAAAYACAHQDRIASIVVVTVEAPAGCTRPMPILAFHGTADPAVPYGNYDPNAPGGVTGTEANMASWAATARCAPAPTVTEVGAEVTRLEWTGCADGAEVVLYRIIGGGHAWPGPDPTTGATPSIRPVSATDEAVAFFSRHSL